jgi:hypothetical protein
VAVSFIGGGPGPPRPDRYSNSQHQVGTDWIGSCKSNYHAITATTAPINRIRNNTELKTWRHAIGQSEQNESHWKSTIIFICGVPRENTELTQFADIHYRLQGCIEHISPRAGLDLSSLKVIRINCISRCKVLYYHDLSGISGCLPMWSNHNSSWNTHVYRKQQPIKHTHVYWVRVRHVYRPFRLYTILTVVGEDTGDTADIWSVSENLYR